MGGPAAIPVLTVLACSSEGPRRGGKEGAALGVIQRELEVSDAHVRGAIQGRRGRVDGVGNRPRSRANGGTIERPLGAAAVARQPGACGFENFVEASIIVRLASTTWLASTLSTRSTRSARSTWSMGSTEIGRRVGPGRYNAVNAVNVVNVVKNFGEVDEADNVDEIVDVVDVYEMSEIDESDDFDVGSSLSKSPRSTRS